MYNIYLYPKSGDTGIESRNPYMHNLETSLTKHFNIVNKKSNKKGVLDFFKYLFSSDIYYFNWIENLASLRYGKIQIVFFVFFLFCCRISGKKIVWTLHNKYAHNISKNYWTDLMFKMLMKNADLIITHSGSGIDFVKTNYTQYASKVIYIIHPVEPVLTQAGIKEDKYDFLIWGIIYPYKGILEFLEFIHNSGYKNDFKILIAGKCLDEKYKNRIKRYLSETILHSDNFYELENISVLAGQSKFTLYTYNADSVLSSGSLMDSIRMGATIIGPRIGAFKDLGSFNFVKTYDKYEEIISIYKNYDLQAYSTRQESANFCSENSWGKFADWFADEFSKTV